MADEINKSPQVYMQMAIDAMMHSIEEPRTDGKISPKVGAVLVRPDGTIETASRGELRYGDHAEFTLLERKNRSARLDGSILYATLEPCAPGARRHPKLGCAERIVNARISEVWIGIEDPDPDVDRKGIKYLIENGIKVFMFPPEFQKPIREANKEFLKQANERALDRKDKNETSLSPLEDALPTFDIKQFSNEAIRYYIEKAKLTYAYDSPKLYQHFENIGLVKRIGGKGKEKLVPTGFGLILFGENPSEKFQQAVVKAKVKYGSAGSIPKGFEGPLVLIPKDIELWLQQVLHSDISREKFERTTQFAFPIEPLREAVINALAHRDYDIKGAKTFIEIDDDKIVIKSAGLPVLPITLEDVKSFKASQLSRNPKITYVLNKMDLMEESELGMETFRSVYHKYGLPLPEYNYKAPYLSITFSRSIDAVRKSSESEIVQQLKDELLEGYEWIKASGEVSTKDYASHFEYTQRTASRHLSDLLKLGLLVTNNANPRSPKLKYAAKV
jgi:ATP-dependent DNA helicase RecG